MRKMKYFFHVGAVLITALLLGACSSEEESINAVRDADGKYVYTMYLDGGIPSFDETRATASWANGSIVYLRFLSGNDNITGTATYDSSTASWKVVSSSALTSNSSSTVYAYYFENEGSVTNSSVTLTEQTAVFTGTGTYTHPNSTDIFVTVTLSPKTWRLRFQGTAGQTLAVRGSKSTISYYSSFNRSSGQLSVVQKDVNLSVASNGYTPYVYGTWTNSGSNTLYVTTDADYYRAINSSSLAIGGSAYTNRPTSSSYNPWTKVETVASNCEVRPNLLLTLSKGYAFNYVPSDNVSYGYSGVLPKSDADKLTDAQLIDYLLTTNRHTREYYANYLAYDEECSPNTDYCFCSVAYNSAGQRGTPVRVYFQTKSATNQPLARITNFSIGTAIDWDYQSYYAWYFSTSMQNTSRYYMDLYEDQTFYGYPDYIVAWHYYYWIKSGVITSSYLYSQNVTNGYYWFSGNYATLTTWALFSNGELSGEVSVRRAYISTNSRKTDSEFSDVSQPIVSPGEYVMKDRTHYYKKPHDNKAISSTFRSSPCLRATTGGLLH